MTLLCISSSSSSRQAVDLLPYAPGFRRFFTPLPTSAADMELKEMLVPVWEIECVTQTVLQWSGPMWYTKVKKGVIIHVYGQENYRNH